MANDKDNHSSKIRTSLVNEKIGPDIFPLSIDPNITPLSPLSIVGPDVTPLYKNSIVGLDVTPLTPHSSSNQKNK